MDQTVNQDKPNRFGLSKKTNIAMTGLGVIAAVQGDWRIAVIAALVTCYCATLQYRVDMAKIGKDLK